MLAVTRFGVCWKMIAGVVVLDDLSTGHREVVTLFERVYGPEQFCFEHVNLLDRGALASVFDGARFLWHYRFCRQDAGGRIPGGAVQVF